MEAGWSVPLLLLCFVTLWTAFLSIAYLGAGLHPDVLETWTLGRHFAWGSAKHPPLMGWVTGAWTSIFPTADWSLQLMAMTNAALALWLVDLISRRFVSGDKRLIVLFLLMLTPVYQFHAQRFNANAVLLATWPLATYCFLRAFETRAAPWAVAAGGTAGLAMLGKYYSVFLIASFVLAALAHPLRRPYFASASPWLSVVTGLVVLSPHLYWLAATGAPTFSYALAHTGFDVATSLREVCFFLLGLAAAMGVSAITWVTIAGYRLRHVGQDFAAMTSNLKLICYIAIGTIALPTITSLVVGTDLPSLWALQGLFLFAVLIVCGTSYRIERFYVVNATVLVAAIAGVAVMVAAPIHALYRNRYGYEEGRSFFHEAANQLTRQWRELTGVPLVAVGGNDSLGLATALYSPDHPDYGQPLAHQYALALPGDTTLDHGWAALCFDDQPDCIDQMERIAIRAGGLIRRDFTIRSQLFGLAGAKRTVVAVMVMPRREQHGTVDARRGAPADANAVARQSNAAE